MHINSYRRGQINPTVLVSFTWLRDYYIATSPLNELKVVLVLRRSGQNVLMTKRPCFQINQNGFLRKL